MSHWVNTTHLAQVGPQELVGVEGHAGLKMDPKMGGSPNHPKAMSGWW